jgi:hypothetical protein
VQELFGGVLGKQFVSSPRDERGDEVTDGLVDYGDEVVLIEIKSAILRHDVKYSGDADRLKKELKLKFVKESQLARALVRLFGPQRLGKRLLKRMRRSDDDTPSIVYPVLVTDDSSLAAHGIESFLGDLVEASLSGSSLPSRTQIARLNVLTTQDVESLLPMLQRGLKLKRVFRERLEVDAPTLNTFHNYLCDVATRMGLEELVDRPALERVFDDAQDFWLRAFPEANV